jgi:tRNA nucleotidyltransferase (CCA-adding enzyme)
MAPLDERLTRDELDELRALGRLAEDAGCRLYIVGGWVRDLALGGPHKDRDLVVEGDARAFAEALAAQWRETGAEVRVEWHERFLTACVQPTVGSAGPRVDIATARSETYERPGALPTVSPADIATDLWRRDFACNALAVSLSPDHFARMLDPCSGGDDIGLRVLRVLHDGSFLDDPTRILRAVNFEQRLSFAIESHTMSLLREAVESGALATVSADRISAVLHPSLGGEAAAGIVARLEELGVWEALGKRQAAGAGSVAPRPVPAEVECSLGEFRLTDPAIRAAAHLVAVAVGAGDDAHWLTPYLEKGERCAADVAAGLLSSPPEALLTPDARPSEVRAALTAVPVAAQVVLCAAQSAPRTPRADQIRQRMLQCWREWRHVSPDVTGVDLLQAGCPQGPAIGAALEAALAMKLDANASRDEQLALALKIARHAKC